MFRVEFRILCLAALIALGACGLANAKNPASGDDGSDPVVDDSKTSKALEGLQPKPLAQRPPVTIYEFRSSVEEVNGQAATDMFTTALVKSSQFRVVERNRLNSGIVAEKQLNGAGQSTGNAAQKQLRGARYIFEGTVSEANAGQESHQGGLNIGGMSLSGGHNKDVIGIDVRILDAETGDVLDSVNVRKALDSSNSGVSGVSALAGTIASMKGASLNPLTPDVEIQNSHKEGVDKALRACIESAVLALVKRVNLLEGGDAPAAAGN